VAVVKIYRFNRKSSKNENSTDYISESESERVVNAIDLRRRWNPFIFIN